MNKQFPIKPLKKYVVVKMSEVKDTTAGGIILTGGRTTRDQSCLVIVIGSEVTEVRAGDRVQIQNGDFKLVKHESLPDDGEYAMVLEDHIIGIFYDEE